MATFPIDHVLPKSMGGKQELENLALTCPHCNAHKWTATEGIDPETGRHSPLFDPRRDDWSSHFQWDSIENGNLDGLTPTGRATIVTLRINDPDMIALRRLLRELGIVIE